MARKTKETAADDAPKMGHNELSDDQRYALTEQHRKQYEALLDAKKKADAALKAHCKVVKAELGAHGLADIKELIVLSTPEGEAAIKAEMERRARVLRWMGVAIGTQGSLFDEVDRTPIDDRAFADGKRDGLAGKSLSSPHHETTSAHHRYCEGWYVGQDIVAKQGFKPLSETIEGDGASEPSSGDEYLAGIQAKADEDAKAKADLLAAAGLGSSRPTFTVET